MNSIWTLEYRTRERKNGKWSEWNNLDRVGCGDKYETRAVEFVRKEIA